MKHLRLVLPVFFSTMLAACNGDGGAGAPAAPALVARRVTHASDLIGGPLAEGRVGDYLLANARIRAIIKKPGRDFSFLLTYGGNIIDADVVRPPGEPGRDNFGGMTPMINVSSTANVQEIRVINDGSNGEPAVIRTFGVDDLFDPIDPGNAIRFISGGIVALPESAIDTDIPVEITTEYTLGADDEAIRIETTIANLGDEALTLYIGDYVNGSGEVENFVPSFGFGEVIFRPRIPFLAYAGVGSASDVTYGIIPLALPGSTISSSGFGQSGFFAYLLGQDILEVLLTGQPGTLVIPAGESRSYVRYFAISDGDVGSVAAIQQRLLGTVAGRIEGRVTIEGKPAAGALVSVVRKPGELGAPYNVVTSFRSSDDGSFGGSVEPGDYLVVAKVPGHPYESGARSPVEHPVSVKEGAAARVDVDVPESGRLVVSVSDPQGGPLPAKVSLVGFDPAPDPGNRTSFAIISIDGFVFTSDVDQKGAELFGLAGVFFVGAAGTTGDVKVPPGDYEVVVSRGPEYSIHRQRVAIRAGETTRVAATLVRVIDTTGFIAGDHHVHLINSLDSAVTRDDRLLTMAAEGVEYFVATDHDYLTDLRPDVGRLGLERFVATGVGSEITTFNFGHFNAWPLRRDPDRVAGSPIDWGRAGVAPGRDYPSLGSYELSPSELFAEARSRFDGGPNSGVVQVNHLNSGMLGYFQVTGIDTGVDPPRSSVDPRQIRQNPGLTNLYDDGFDALELWIEGSRGQTQLLFEANLGDWFNLLNQGRIKAGMADSDTHTTAIVQAGGPRSYLASSSDDPAQLNPGQLAASVADGRVICTNAPFLRVAVIGDGGAAAGLGLGQPRLVTAMSGEVTIRVNVQSPQWAEIDRVELYVNTVPTPIGDGSPVPRYAVEPDLTLFAGADFEIRREEVTAGNVTAARWEADLDIETGLDSDAWVVVLVRGTDGVSRPLWPMNPQNLDRARNQTLDDLTDGNLGEGGNTALAFTNPLFVDVDGNGRFDPSGELP